MTSDHTYSTEGPQCPYCERQYTADEPHYYDKMGFTQDVCDACGGAFSVQVYTSTSWTCEPMEGGEPTRPKEAEQQCAALPSCTATTPDDGLKTNPNTASKP